MIGNEQKIVGPRDATSHLQRLREEYYALKFDVSMASRFLVDTFQAIRYRHCLSEEERLHFIITYSISS